MFLEARAYATHPEILRQLMELLKAAEGIEEYEPDHPLHLLQTLRTNWKHKMKITHNFQYWTIFWKHVHNYYFRRPKEKEVKRALDILKSEFERSEPKLDKSIHEESKSQHGKWRKLKTLVDKASSDYESESAENKGSVSTHFPAERTLEQEQQALVATYEELRLDNLKQLTQLGQLASITNEPEPNDQFFFQTELLRQIYNKEKFLYSSSMIRAVRCQNGFFEVYFDCEYLSRPLHIQEEVLLKFVKKEKLRSLINAKEGPYCHRCLRIPKTRIMACNYRVYGKYDQTYAENPYRYLDAMYMEYSEPAQPYYYPFLTYRKSSKTGHMSCGKLFCQACLSKAGWNDKKINMLESCPFCTGHCKCDRCTMAYSVVRHHAEYLHHGGTLKDLMSQSLVYSVFNQTDPQNDQSTPQTRHRK